MEMVKSELGGWRKGDKCKSKEEGERIRKFLGFLLSSFRCKIRVLQSESYPFDFDLFSKDFQGLSLDPSLLSLSLKWIVDEGLLDSLVPHLKPSYRIITKQIKNSHPESLLLTTQNKFHQGINKLSKTKEETEILIHVFEEGKGIAQDFKCPQSVLLRGMGYFARVGLKGQNLLDMDISVHCEIKIFDWLLQWISSTNHKDKITEINGGNVVGLVVSAEFLEMPSLTMICLDLMKNEMENLLTQSPNLGCLSETLVGRLANLLNPLEIENRIVGLDESDRITSRLYSHWIMGMSGDLASQIYPITTLFKCLLCRKLVTNQNASLIPCLRISITQLGKEYAEHERDPHWSLTNFIRESKRELRTWRRVYWRLWGLANYLRCLNCGFYYPVGLKGSCRFHPERNDSSGEPPLGSKNLKQPQFFKPTFGRMKSELVGGTDTPHSTEDEPPVQTRRLTCCNKRRVKFNPIHLPQGCRSRSHLPDSSRWIDQLESIGHLMEEDGESDLYGQLGKIPRTRESSKVGEELIGGNPRDPSHLLLSQYGFGRIGQVTNPNKGMSDLWPWNPDLTTRYNQDMQREMEEKLMIGEATSLSLRIPLSF